MSAAQAGHKSFGTSGSDTQMRIFRKSHGASCGGDWARVDSLYEASRKASAFWSPKPLRLDLEAGTIDYEHLPEGRLLAHILFRAMASGNRQTADWLGGVLEQVGRALGQLHRYMKLSGSQHLKLNLEATEGLPGDTKARIAQQLRSGQQRSFHGDFGTGNIWVCSEDDRIVIFDPIPARFCPDRTADVAPVYYDIGHMISTLWFTYPVWLYPFIRIDLIDECVAALISGYQDEAETELDRSTTFCAALVLMDAYNAQLNKEMPGLRQIIRRPFYRKRRAALLKEVLL